MQHKAQIDTRIAAGFLTRSFHLDETIAIVLRRVSPATIAQRIVTLKRALQPRYLAWLAHENASGANIYVAANPLAPGSRKRTKESIAEVRHLYLDLDTDGDAKLDRFTRVECSPDSDRNRRDIRRQIPGALAGRRHPV